MIDGRPCRPTSRSRIAHSVATPVTAAEQIGTS